MSIDPRDVNDAQIEREMAQQLGEVSPEDLARLSGATPKTHDPTQRGRVNGRIVSIHGNDVFVDIGGKSEAVVSLEEFDPAEPPAVGQELSFVPQGFDAESGLMRLSLREARVHANLEALRVGDVVRAKVTGSNIGGLELRVHGLRGFMPMSQVDLVRREDFASHVNHWLECEVVEIDRKGKNVVLSRRRVLERQREEDRQQLRFQLAEGQVRKGVVRRLADFGAFVDLGGIDGLLHVSDMSYSRINHPSEMLKEGDEVEVKVIKLDLVKDRISLGLKQLATDPWTTVEGKYHPGDTVDGKVTRLMDFGAFVEIEPGVEGLIPVSEMSWTQRIMHPKDILKPGDGVRVAVLSLDPAKRKISLSLKALTQDPWLTAAERYVPQTQVSGAVTRITNFGAFVQLEEGVEGLIHISELSNQRVRAVSDVVSPGQVVQVRVLAVDTAQRRIALSMKPLVSAAPAGEPEPVSPAKAAKKRKRELRGGLSY
ncbi:MAG: S1 RNA-binding domain-containing protein [Phycisphaerales bacterium]|nr:S1 RNA-binding domain-containing protein [Phycisphaerales bacterium]